MACLFCDRPSMLHLKVCVDCFEIIERQKLGSLQDKGVFFIGQASFPGLSLWSYAGLVRDCVLDFKVRRHWMSGVGLINYAIADERVQAWLQEVDVIMPAPSSFWSRIRGRFDLAALFAWRLSLEADIPYIESPRCILGRWKKQALVPKKLRNSANVERGRSLRTWDEFYFYNSLPFLAQPKRPCVLVVDDVVTSAHTLTDLANRFRNISFRFLTLASAQR